MLVCFFFFCRMIVNIKIYLSYVKSFLNVITHKHLSDEGPPPPSSEIIAVRLIAALDEGL